MRTQIFATASRARRWSLAAAATLAVAGMCASPLFAATPPSGTDNVSAQAKDGTHRQTAAEFQQALGVPLEDAGGGWHAVLENSSDGFKEALKTGGFTVNAMELDFVNKRAIAYVSGRLPDPATVARYSREAAEHGFGTTIVPVWRTEADAMKQQERIDNHRKALAARGIEIGVTAITLDAQVRVDVYDGTQAKADYLTKTYGPEGLQVNIGEVPHPHEAPLYGSPPPVAG
ncbi:MAG: hypothetical protein WBX27_10770 [Specibacter sp.]